MTNSGAQDRLLLAGDVGGTKTDLAVISAERGPRQPLAQQRFPSAEYESLEDLAGTFIQESGHEVHAACLDVAGPVIEGRAQLTNLPWEVSEASLAAALGLERVRLLNDLVAVASAVPILLPEELHVVKEGEAVKGGPIAVIAPGTGLGEAFLVGEAGEYRAFASEGGHAAFAPADDLQVELLRELWRTFDHVSFERVASGVGIPHVYEFLRDRRGIAETKELALELERAEDRTRPVIEAALDQNRRDELARATVELFLAILGAETGNLALKVLGTGGVYLAGGLAQALAGALGTAPFLSAFTNGGRLTEMLERVPIYVVKGEVALLGVASEGLKLLAGAPAVTR